MPNTRRGLKTSLQTIDYTRNAEGKVRKDQKMTFIPIGLVNEDTTLEMMISFMTRGIIDFKIYPRYRTTQSDNGVVNYGRVITIIREASAWALEHMGERIRVHLHPEHPSKKFSEREGEYGFLAIGYLFLQETEAIIIWEHGTDRRCIPHWKQFALDYHGRFYLTLTAHHLATHADEVYGDVRAVCKPSFKDEADMESLIDLVVADYYWVMLGSDSAPHDIHKKHVHHGLSACGDFTAPFLIRLLAHALDRLLKTVRGIEIFINFTSRNARKLYFLTEKPQTIELVRQESYIPASYKVGSWTVEPFWATRKLLWSRAQGESPRH